MFAATEKLSQFCLERLEAAGQFLLNGMALLGEQCLLSVRSSVLIFSLSRSQRRYVRGVVVNQIYFTGYQALGLVSLVSVAVGTIISFYSSSEVALQSGEMTVRLLYLVGVKEVGPLICALVVIARSGTAVASELGSMKVNSELLALKAVGAHPLSFVVLPRLVGGVLSEACLVIFFGTGTLLAGYVFSLFTNPMTLSYFMLELSHQLGLLDLLLLGAKAFGTGVIIFACASYYGLQVQRSSHEIPQATTRAVVAAIGGVLVWCVILSVLHLNLVHGWGGVG